MTYDGTSMSADLSTLPHGTYAVTIVAGGKPYRSVVLHTSSSVRYSDRSRELAYPLYVGLGQRDGRL